MPASLIGTAALTAAFVMQPPPAPASSERDGAAETTDTDPGPDRAYAGPAAVPDAEPSVRVAAPLEPRRDEAPTADRNAPPPAKERIRHRWVYRNVFSARYNPLGFSNRFTTGWRLQLSMAPGAIFEDTFFGLKLDSYVTPAFARGGPRIELQPFSFLNVSATYHYAGYFGVLSQLISFPSAHAVHDDDTLGELGDAGENYVTQGSWVELYALLQAKIRHVAMRADLTAYYSNLQLRDGDEVYYNQTFDILQPNDGWMVVNDAQLLYLFDFGLTLAARHTLTHAFFRPQHYGPDESAPKSTTTLRLGPSVLYTFYDRPDRRFNRPTVFALAQWWLRHPYRTGQEVNVGLPSLMIGLLFDGDFLPNPRRRRR